MEPKENKKPLCPVCGENKYVQKMGVRPYGIEERYICLICNEGFDLDEKAKRELRAVSFEDGLITDLRERIDRFKLK